MPTNMIISSTNYADTGTVTVDNAVGTLPITNLQDRQIVKIWRNSQTTAQIDVDFGQGRIVDFAALIKHTISQTGKIRWRLSNASDFSSTVYDSGLIDAWPIVEEFGTLPWGVFSWGGYLNITVAAQYTISTFAVLSSPVQARYLRIDISDADNTDGYIQAGRLIAGPAYKPSINYGNGIEFEFVDDSRVTKSRGGQTFIDEIERFRRIRFDLINLPENEMFQNVFNAIDRLRGVAQDILIIPQPDEPTTWITQNIYGRITQTSPIVNSALNFYGRQIEVEELI
tara:strand:- start:124 stop:975 length:852 start_codon:yes stop_codon:yes gene_type:complete